MGDSPAERDLVDLMERRIARAMVEDATWTPLSLGSDSDFRIDLERIRFAPAFARLSEVTQVVSAGSTGEVVHNRLTHTIKVTTVARSLAVGLADAEDPDRLDALGGLDPVVAQAGAVSHDLGHPPFGHLGERTLDRLARDHFGLNDGFEGNAQTFRILTQLEVYGNGQDGLNLTAAVRAAVLKYPWGRLNVPNPHPRTWDEQPRGAGHGPDGPGSGKFNAYVPDLGEMLDVLDIMQLEPGRQSLECSVMDLADDVAYSLHDLEDFHRSGVLQFSPIAGELRAWEEQRSWFEKLSEREIAVLSRTPGIGLESLRRRMAAKDGWIYNDDDFAAAVRAIGVEFVSGVLTVPYDGSMAAHRSISRFTGSWIDRFSSAVILTGQLLGKVPPMRAPLVTVRPAQWHEMQVLKFIHQYFVLHRPDLAMLQRGQAHTISQLVRVFDEWLSDRMDAVKAPHRLIDLVELAEAQYVQVRDTHPEWLGGRTSDTELARMWRGRGIIDFVAGLTDGQALAYANRLGPTTRMMWASGAL